MIETLTVSLSGPAFSFLLYENTKNKYGQEGFLLGEIVEKETRTITDNDQKQVHVSRVVKINSSVPCCKLGYFYDGIGRVDVEKIKSFLGELTSKVVAWYKYSPSSSFNFTFRERLVHQQLANFFKVPSEFFTCCLLISESSDNGSTHSYTQNFVRYLSHSYEQLPLHIVNLSDANNTYKRSESVSESFLNILEGLNINHRKSQGLTIITKIENALQQHTNSVVEKLSKAEQRLFELENEVKNVHEGVQLTKPNCILNNKEAHLNDINVGVETRPDSPILSTKKSGRIKSKATVTKGEKRNNQSPTKKNAQESPRETSTRLRKRN